MRRRKKKWTAVLLATVLAVQSCSLLLASFYKTKADDEAERNRFAYLQETDYSVGDEIAAARQKLEKNPQNLRSLRISTPWIRRWRSASRALRTVWC